MQMAGSVHDAKVFSNSKINKNVQARKIPSPELTIFPGWVQVECTVGRLKARWGFLRRKVALKIETIPKAIYTCFALHHFYESFSNHQLDESEV